MEAERLQGDAVRPLGRSSRRTFLGQVGGVTAAALGAAVVGVPAVSAVASSMTPGRAALAAVPLAGGKAEPALPVFRGERHMLDELTQETFARHLHSPFRVHQGEGPHVDLTLVEAVHTSHHAPEQGLESFSLMFQGPRDVALPQDTYTMEHEHLGQLGLFIVPMGLDDQGRYYQCIFNRLARG